jgi:hypothetical protein
MNGRTYHFMPSSQTHNPRGGMSYFTFDAPLAYEHLRNHADVINRGGKQRIADDINAGN